MITHSLTQRDSSPSSKGIHSFKCYSNTTLSPSAVGFVFHLFCPCHCLNGLILIWKERPCRVNLSGGCALGVSVTYVLTRLIPILILVHSSGPLALNGNLFPMQFEKAHSAIVHYVGNRVPFGKQILSRTSTKWDWGVTVTPSEDKAHGFKMYNLLGFK